MKKTVNLFTMCCHLTLHNALLFVNNWNSMPRGKRSVEMWMPMSFGKTYDDDGDLSSAEWVGGG